MFSYYAQHRGVIEDLMDKWKEFEKILNPSPEQAHSVRRRALGWVGQQD